MAFEIKPAGAHEKDPRVVVVADGDWHKVLTLARRHGFDPRSEYEGNLLPEPGVKGVLEVAAAQALAVALSEALRQETEAGGEGGIRVGPPGEPEAQVEWATMRGVGEIAESGSLTVVHLTP